MHCNALILRVWEGKEGEKEEKSTPGGASTHGTQLQISFLIGFFPCDIHRMGCGLMGHSKTSMWYRRVSPNILAYSVLWFSSFCPDTHTHICTNRQNNLHKNKLTCWFDFNNKWPHLFMHHTHMVEYVCMYICACINSAAKATNQIKLALQSQHIRHQQCFLGLNNIGQLGHTSSCGCVSIKYHK